MNCTKHQEKEHKHSPNCGHKSVQHGDHVDYLHDGHMHHMAGDQVHDHCVPESATNETKCTPDHKCHDTSHSHSSSCGHEIIPHHDHVDYLVEGHLHHPCAEHCDNHGAFTWAIS